jgi:hypothetical protein
MELYSAIRKNDTMWFEGKWMKLEGIVLSEVSQVQKDKGRHVFSHTWKIQKINIYTKTNMIIYKLRCLQFLGKKANRRWKVVTNLCATYISLLPVHGPCARGFLSLCATEAFCDLQSASFYL